MAETSFKEGVKEVADQARPREVKPKLEEAVDNQPLLPHLLSFKVVLIALAIAAVAALLMFLLVSPLMAGVALIIVFFAAWFGLATISYGKAEDERKASKDDEAEEDS